MVLGVRAQFRCEVIRGVFGVGSQFPCKAPEGRDEVEGNLGSDPENARFRTLPSLLGPSFPPVRAEVSKPRFPHPFGLRYRSLALDHSPGPSQSSGAALSPRRATHFLLLRQEKVSKEKATRSLGSFWGRSPNSPSLWLALRVRCFASQRNWCLTPITHLAVLGADGNFRNLSAAQPSDI